MLENPRSFPYFLHENADLSQLLEYEIQQPVRVEICGHDTIFRVIRLPRQIFDLLELKRAVSLVKVRAVCILASHPCEKNTEIVGHLSLSVIWDCDLNLWSSSSKRLNSPCIFHLCTYTPSPVSFSRTKSSSPSESKSPVTIPPCPPKFFGRVIFCAFWNVPSPFPTGPRISGSRRPPSRQ